MVFVAIKHLIFGKSKPDSSRSPLLPSTEPTKSSYRSINSKSSYSNSQDNNQDMFGTSPTFTIKSSFGNSYNTTTVTNEADDVASSSSSITSALTSVNNPDYNNDSDSSSSSSAFIPPRVMSDIIIGLSDGLTVPFALTAGLSSLGDSKLVITGGLAELVSGAISMGLGGYLAAKSESECYHHEVARERELHERKPEISESCVEEILSEYSLSPATIKMVFNDMNESPAKMMDFIIKFGKGLEEPAEGREFSSALTIGSAYFLGGFVPLIPYFFIKTVDAALLISVIVMLTTLFVFGVLKTTFTLGWDCGKTRIAFNGVQMVLTGGIAAGAAWALVKLIE